MGSQLAFNRRTAARAGGYSLIEVVVASIVVSIFVMGIFTIISGGTDLNRKEMLRRRVFQELERVLEKPEYSSRSPYYYNLASTGGAFINFPQVTLDSTSGATLKATPRVKVDAVTFSFGGTNVPAKKITVKIDYLNKSEACSESLETIITLTDIN